MSTNSARRPYAEPPTIVSELIEALTPHPQGLRRWSVMRAIRQRRDRDSRDTSPKFEIEVERAFRAACLGDPSSKPDRALFYRPKDKAGEVWALYVPETPVADSGTDTGTDTPTPAEPANQNQPTDAGAE